MASNSTGWFNAGSSPSVQTNCTATLTRSGTTVTCNWTCEQQLGSGSYLGYGSLEIGCGYAGVNDYRTIKEHSSSWSGGSYHSVSGSFSFSDSSTTSKNFAIGFWSTSDAFSSSGLFEVIVNVTLEGYNPTASFTTQPRLDAKQINTATIYYLPNRTLNACEWRLYSGSSWSSWYGMNTGTTWISGSWSTGGQFKILNLAANTTYKVQIRIQATSGGAWTNSNELSFTTYQIGTLTAAANFNHGSSGTYTIEQILN